MYDPDLSKKGVLMSTARAVRHKQALELLLEERANQNPYSAVTGKVLAPNALPMYRDPSLQHKTKRKREQEHDNDPSQARKPEAPTTAKHLVGGRSSASVNFTQFVVQSTIKNKNIAGKDPRADLFQYNEGKNYIEQAYAGDTTRVLAEKTVEEEQEEIQEGNNRKKKSK
jgi:hypothetical protein